MKHKFRQPFSGFSHLISAIVAIVCSIWLIRHSINYGTSSHILSFSVFCISLILLYLSSAVYHLSFAKPETIRVLRKIDHMMITIFIAGCYTPICLIALKESFGVPLLIAIWIIALLGAIKDLYWTNAPRWVRVGLYLVMGWLAVIALPQLITVLPSGAISLIVAEGIIYTLGAVIYATKWPNPVPEVFGFHEIWHLFVMAGSACHFLLIALYLLPLPSH